ncbi:MAG: MlaD family protein [Thermodesulfobacteriota bacterium]
MTDLNQAARHAATAETRGKRTFSIVWVVPIVALLIGAWLAYKAISEKGPSITITFSTAEGLEAGKTKIKYRDVEVGQIEEITLDKDISRVVVKAKMPKGSEKYLTDKTRFWVVRARIRGGSVSGIGTVLSGAYIAVDPDRTGQATRSFTGLEVPPVVTLGQPGRHFRINTDNLGSLDIGAPVYYRQIQVGQVVGYSFGADGKEVDIQLFIEAPYHSWVTENTRFWNASGIDVSLNAQGLKVNTQSMVSILSGGIAFDVPNGNPPGKEAEENRVFRLYPDRASIQEKIYSVRRYWMLLFDQSVRGLSVGAPVELHGIQIGKVVSLDLEYDVAMSNFYVPVLVAIEPERIRVSNGTDPKLSSDEKSEALLKWLVEDRGLRAQLKTGSLLTGQLMVNLEFHPAAAKEKLAHRDGYPLVPTIPGSLEQLQESLTKITSRLEKVPFDELSADLRLVLQEARTTLQKIGGFAGTLSSETAPEMQATLVELQQTLETLQGTVGVELQKTLVELQKSVGQDSPLNYNARKTLEELALTLRSLRELTSTLEQQPQSILFGKENKPRE